MIPNTRAMGGHLSVRSPDRVRAGERPALNSVVPMGRRQSALKSWDGGTGPIRTTRERGIVEEQRQLSNPRRRDSRERPAPQSSPREPSHSVVTLSMLAANFCNATSRRLAPSLKRPRAASSTLQTARAKLSLYMDSTSEFIGVLRLHFPIMECSNGKTHTEKEGRNGCCVGGAAGRVRHKISRGDTAGISCNGPQAGCQTPWYIT